MTKRLGLVSTIIPIYNRSALAIESIQSVLNQTYRPIEVLVVDDGSIESEAEIIKQFASRHSEIKYFKQENAGPGMARELGRKHATGEFIQYHDSDDLLLESKFELQVSALNNNQDCDIAYGKTATRALGSDIEYKAIKKSGEEIKSLFPSSLKSRWWSTSTPLYRRSIIDQAGAWLPLINEEDWEYECRIASYGVKLCYVNEFVSVTQYHDDHLHAQGTIDVDKLKSRCKARNLIYLHAIEFMKLDHKTERISSRDWMHFSKSVFLLCRECAFVGLVDEAKDMYDLSIKAIGKTTKQHQIFNALRSLLGWRAAAKLIKIIGK